MGLFKKKKKFEIPRFQEFPRFEDNIPKYEPTLSKIKQEIETPHDFDFTSPEEHFKPINIPERKPIITEKYIVNRPPLEEGKPIFVKIDQYKEALELLEEIKRKIKDAENIFAEIEKLKEERDKKLDAWKASLQQIKDRLMATDKKLFEV